ncbi:MAG: hypothetical protein JWP64_1860 [Pseudonocardia sp.]|jgi:hypothetical protein|nr:hypothetical protein [Pseudonocardia sp.]MDT7702333.1 hypothetical protein [Pseudonocardiales bacterium]
MDYLLRIACAASIGPAQDRRQGDCTDGDKRQWRSSPG